jgi:DNA repair photolyase
MLIIGKKKENMGKRIYDKNKKLIKKAFGTNEWASRTKNFIKGCSNNCKYCYGKAMAVQYGRCTPDDWPNEVVDMKKLKVVPRKTPGRIMFPSTHDITKSNVKDAVVFISNLFKNGNEILVVTKPDPTVIKTICDTFQDQKDQILFRFTIGSADNATLKFWEPNAPGFSERLDALEYAFQAGYKTSISSEPMLDTNIDGIIEKCIEFITDAIWIGKPNKLLQRLKVNGEDDKFTIDAANELIAVQDDNWVLSLYQKHKDNPKIKWKSSMKKIIGIQIPTIKGLDK